MTPLYLSFRARVSKTCKRRVYDISSMRVSMTVYDTSMSDISGLDSESRFPRFILRDISQGGIM